MTVSKKNNNTSKTNENEGMTLEEGLAELGNMIKLLESPDISLEDSFSIYNKGMLLLKDCNNAIEKIEQQLVILEENS